MGVARWHSPVVVCGLRFCAAELVTVSGWCCMFPDRHSITLSGVLVCDGSVCVCVCVCVTWHASESACLSCCGRFHVWRPIGCQHCRVTDRVFS